MKLIIHADEQAMPLEVPDAVVADGHSFFDKLDGDMSGGWQIGRKWVDKPDNLQRSQIVADRLLDAMHGGKVELALLLAGYILARNPDATGVRYGEEGDIAQIEILGPESEEE